MVFTLSEIGSGDVIRAVSPRWKTIPVGPLDVPSSCALFAESCPGACDDKVEVEASRLAGGNPRWIERVSGHMTPKPQRLSIPDLAIAVERVLSASAFSIEIEHIERHANPDRIRRALRLAAEEGATTTSVRVRIAQREHLMGVQP